MIWGFAVSRTVQEELHSQKAGKCNFSLVRVIQKPQKKLVYLESYPEAEKNNCERAT